MDLFDDFLLDVPKFCNVSEAFGLTVYLFSGFAIMQRASQTFLWKLAGLGCWIQLWVLHQVVEVWLHMCGCYYGKLWHASPQTPTLFWQHMNSYRTIATTAKDNICLWFLCKVLIFFPVRQQVWTLHIDASISVIARCYASDIMESNCITIYIKNILTYGFMHNK